MGKVQAWLVHKRPRGALVDGWVGGRVCEWVGGVGGWLWVREWLGVGGILETRLTKHLMLSTVIVILLQLAAIGPYITAFAHKHNRICTFEVVDVSVN